jgi:UDP-N-acetylmuramoyl-L-alanyl-D-glutamate--2,6-diaminopimelate ligase
MLLSELFSGQPDVEITGLTLDSRTVKPGYMFFCIKGYEQDGHRYAASAADKGAAAIVITEDVEQKPGVVYIKVSDMNAELNRVCDLFFGQPSRHMTVFGATGTNGKSTLTSVISDIYSHYRPCGYMGTIAIRYGDYSRVANLTTPDQVETHANLKEMLDHGMQAAAMEVSSQGLDRGRVDSVDFDCAVFTNLTHDHLDYHKTMENYFEAKKRLFRNLKPSAVAVLNADDEISIQGLKDCCPCRYVTYGTDQGESETDENGYPIEGSHSKPGTAETVDYFAKDIVQRADGCSFTLCYGGKEYPVTTNMAALYNVYNLLGAVAAMHECGMPLQQIIPLLTDIPQVDGRMDRVDEGQPFTVVVDYAHTPDGYEKIFNYAKEITDKTGGKIYAAFGCPGKRDVVKRPVMGRIAGEFCTEVVLTSQDPRDSQPEDIAEQIAEGVKKTPCRWSFVHDRDKGIAKAISLASAGDVVLTLGKGGETYMYYEEGRRPWMTDKAAARKALNELGYKK